jgi:hypothetical protein
MAWRASLDSAYFAHTPAEWARLAETFGADYALVDRERTPTPPAGEPVIVEGRWAVIPLRGPASAEGSQSEGVWKSDDPPSGADPAPPETR